MLHGTYTKTLCVVYLKFICNWCPVFLFAESGNSVTSLNLQPKYQSQRLVNTAGIQGPQATWEVIKWKVR